MTTPTHPRRFRASHPGRPSAMRRSAAVVAGLLVMTGAPLVASALEDDPVADLADLADLAVQRVAAAAAVDEPAYASTRVPALDRRPDPASMRPAERLADDPDPAAARAAEVQAVLTASYAWDEQSSRVSDLQELLQVTVDGRYGWTTRGAHLQVLEFAGLPTSGVPEAPLPQGTTAEQWEALRQCESNGNYSIVSSSGRYRGAYQFNRTTWDSVAGRHDPSLVGVDPAAASPADQDAMAFALYEDRGAQPWPVCGRYLP